MSDRPGSPVAWVQLTQAMVARALVIEFGLPERRAAARLGLVPSAVSQYLSGKRLGAPIARLEADERIRRIARRVAQELVSRPETEVPAGPRILETAVEVAAGQRGERAMPSRTDPSPIAPRGRLRTALRARIRGEQSAVADCMRLAQKSRDELTRAIFRQIASDSLRHAEIVASLETYLDRGVDRTVASGIRRSDIDRLIARERAAEASTDSGLGERLGGVMGLLWESMEADERKHSALLARLRTADLLGPPDRPRRR